MLYRCFVSILSTLLLSCAGAGHVRETVSPRASASADTPLRARKTPAVAARKPKPVAARDAKAAFSDASSLEETPERNGGSRRSAGASSDAASDTSDSSEATDWSGTEVDPSESEDSSAEPHQSVAVKGIEGTMSEFDVRTTLENRNADFDRCHDRARGGSGWIEFKIHILSNGEVGDVKVHRQKVRSREIVECYTGVVQASRFSSPHGGYADVKWTTKVGRSPPNSGDLFERRVRWDAPAGGAQTERTASSRQHRRSRRHHR